MGSDPADAGRAGPHGTDDVVDVRGLTKVYPSGVVAVDDLHLTVRRGEVFGLLGPNGAGKTTTAGMLTTRVLPTRGSVRIDGIDVVASPAAVRRRIGVVPQSNTLDRSLSVVQNLEFHGRYFGMRRPEARRRATALLDRVRLTRFRDAPVTALSGGMAQRLMVARAVMHDPPVLFLDEPTSGLDPQSRLALYELLGELNGAGHTVVLTTHYMEEAELLCDRVAIVDHGRLLAVDTTDALKRRTGAATVATVTADGSLDDLALVLRRDLPGAASVHRAGDAVQIVFDDGVASIPAIVTAADRAGFTLRDVSVRGPTLETVFIELTGTELRE